MKGSADFVMAFVRVLIGESPLSPPSLLPPIEKNRTGIASEKKKTPSGGAEVRLPDTCLLVIGQVISIGVDARSSDS